jgi:hypothetical protein
MTAIVTTTAGRVQAGVKRSVDFPVDLQYDDTDPLAVKFTFYGDLSNPVSWVMAVSLFEDTTVMYSTPAIQNCVTVTFDLALNEVCLRLLLNGKETIIVLLADVVLHFIDKVKALMTNEAVTQAVDGMIRELEALS